MVELIKAALIELYLWVKVEVKKYFYRKKKGIVSGIKITKYKIDLF